MVTYERLPQLWLPMRGYLSFGYLREATSAMVTYERLPQLWLPMRGYLSYGYL
jgi:hypothetical protein